MFRTFLATGALLFASSASHADNNTNCDTVRAQIDSKIRAAGVSHFALTVVAADASVDGKVVGGCGLGTKKIVYDKTASPSAPTAVRAQPRAKPREQPILTECKDGSVNVGGDCKS